MTAIWQGKEFKSDEQGKQLRTGDLMTEGCTHFFTRVGPPYLVHCGYLDEPQD